MVLKDMHVRENLTMDNHQPATNTTFTTRRGCMLSFTTLILIGAFFICTLIAVSFIIYSLAACESYPLERADVICSSTRPPTTKKNVSDLSPYGGGIRDESNLYADIRLPRSVIPLTYNISIIPYLLNANFTFSGEANIVVQINDIDGKDIENITMHAAQLKIGKNDVSVRQIHQLNESNNVSYLKIRKQYFIEPKQFFVIEFFDKLKHNAKYEIRIKFDGEILDYLQGFYRSSYKVGNNTTRWIASTQFQPTDARRAFPCFDEPALKARFTLNIARPDNMTTVSNMPKIPNASKPVENIPNYVWDYYEESLPMSTYLVAFAITDFDHLSENNFTVWARPEAIQSAKYALSVGPKILKYLEEFFNIPFPLPKMDMMALPDFQAGAMENWGLITFRETAMLFEDGISPTTNKLRIVSVISHELAHQWFGNLVTPSWWSDIWLNEGFASYMEYLGVDAVETKWKTMDQFVVKEVQHVFQLDALSSSHKISVEVRNPDEITEIFDRISYSKGATIIRMMSHFLTSKVFRQGLTKYLRENAYRATEQDDLWKFLTAEANAKGVLDKSITVKDIMDTWTLQTGFPLLKVSRKPNSNIIHLEQEKFVYVNNTSDKENPLWWIPITYTTSNELNFNDTHPKMWIPRIKSVEIDNRNLSKADWFIFNIQLTGYYRTNYELDNWMAITQHLMQAKKMENIIPSNRAQLIDDVLNLARGSYLSYDVALNLTRYLVHEDNHVAWRAAIRAFYFIDSMLVQQGDYDLLKDYLLTLVEPIYNKVGFNTDSGDSTDMLTILKRNEILGFACHLGHSNCIAESSRHFQNWIQVPNPDANNPIPPQLRSIIYCTGVRYGTEMEWNFAFERFENGKDSSEKALLLTALGCSREPWILARYLRRALNDDSVIRKQDMSSVFASVASNSVGQQITFDFVRENLESIKAYLGTSKSSLYGIIEPFTKSMNSKFHLAELKAFVSDELKEDSRSLQQMIEKVQINVNWMNQNYKPIIEWLKRERKS